MKRTQRKDTIRNIRKQVVSYLSIIVISMLATTSYLGINFTSTALFNNATRYFDQLNYRDFEITSTMLLTQEDLDAIGNTQGVRDVEGVLQTTARIALPNGLKKVSVVSMTERVNKTRITKGRMPEAANECAVEGGLMDTYGLSVGDTIQIVDVGGQQSELLKEKEFVITGRAACADHYAHMRYVVGDYAVVVDRSAFDMGDNADCFVKAAVDMEAEAGISRFGDDYYHELDQLQPRLEALADERAPMRDAQVRDAYQQKIDDARAELDKAKIELDDNLALLEEYEEKLKEGEKKLKTSQLVLKGMRSDPSYEKYLEKYETSKVELEEGRQELDEGWASYHDACREYEEKLAEADEAQAELDANDDTCHWVVLDARSNGGHNHALNAADSIGKLGMTFAFLFLLMDALVIYVTVGRLVDEQRVQLGTQKALGFFTREIFLKYLTYGVTSTIIGMILGTSIGFLALQRALLKAHRVFYAATRMTPFFDWVLTGIVLLAGVLLATGSVWIACSRQIRNTARDLLLPPIPSMRRTSARPKKSGRNLYARVIVRNMLSDPRRVSITIASVAGCCALLTIGFHLQASVEGALNRQFGDIVRYEQKLTFDPNATETVRQDFEALLEEEGVENIALSSTMLSYTTDTRIDSGELICADAEEIGKYWHLRHADSHEPITLPDEGVVIYNRMARSLGLKTGDTFTIYDAQMNPYTAKVSAIYESYFGYSILISPAAYQAIFEKEAPINSFYFSATGDVEALNRKLQGIVGYEDLIHTNDTLQDFQRIAAVLNMVTAVLTVVAAMMAYFVLLNLINMYLIQKKRELTIMRINGFTTREVIRYVSAEPIITTLMGIPLGLGVGLILGELILSFMEQPRTGYLHEIAPMTLLAATAITLLFSLIINIIALRKVRHLRLVDIA